MTGTALLIGAVSRPASASDVQSAYETATIDRVLNERGLSREPDPEGKTISFIQVVRIDVFDETDPIPEFFNVFHIMTRERVIRRELLFGAGEPYRTARVDESARNLKLLPALSLILLVPVRDPEDPKKVGMVVITKDIWSLRLNYDFQIADGRLNYLLVNPSEWNVAGTHASVGGLFILNLDSYSTGLVLSHSRILGTRLSGSASANVVFNRETGEAEGSFGSFGYGRPLYSTEQRWAFWTGVAWSDTIERRFVGSRPEIFDADATPADDAIPIVYDRERYVGVAQVWRSFGRQHKLDLSAGAEADRRRYRERVPAGTDPAAVEELRREEIPVSDLRLSPFAQLQAYENRFFKTIDLEILGLQEDFRLGYEVLLRLYGASERVGSSRDLVGVLSGLSYTQRIGDGLLRGAVKTTTDYAPDGRHDAAVEAAARVASPRLGFGRLILDGSLGHRYENYLNRRYALGGDTRLRGYLAQEFLGRTFVAANAELRTAGVDILSAQCGLAAFYDVGDAANGWEEVALKQSAGLGLRITFPQFNRLVFRADFAARLGPGQEPFPPGTFITFAQAFPLPGLAEPAVSTAD